MPRRVPRNRICDTIPKVPLRIGRTKQVHFLQVDFTLNATAMAMARLSGGAGQSNPTPKVCRGQGALGLSTQLGANTVRTRVSGGSGCHEKPRTSLEPERMSPQSTLLPLLKLPYLEYSLQTATHRHALLSYYLLASCSDSLQQMSSPTLTDKPY